MKIYITRNLYSILRTYSIAIKSLIVTSGSANYEIEAGNCPTCCIIGLLYVYIYILQVIIEEYHKESTLHSLTLYKVYTNLKNIILQKKFSSSYIINICDNKLSH